MRFRISESLAPEVLTVPDERTTEEKIVVALRNALAEVAGINVREGAQRLEALPDATVQLTLLRKSRQPAPGGKQRWHSGVLVALVSRIGPPDETHSVCGPLLTLSRALLAAVEGARASLLAAGALDYRRDEVVYWYKLPADVGDPAGSYFVVHLEFVE